MSAKGVKGREASQEGEASADETRAEVLRLTGRGYTRVRQLLVQLPDTEDERPSVLGVMVHDRRHRPLVLYLMLLTAWPFLQTRRDPFEGAVWARLLRTERGVPWTPTDVSKAWRELEELGLIKRERRGRQVVIRPRREDGGAEYIVPDGGGDTGDYAGRYLVLPGAFWSEQIFAQLSLPALAMLLVVLKETSPKKHEVWLQQDHAQQWYGFSEASMQKGLRELEEAGLLHRRGQRIKAPLSPTGYTIRNFYSLKGAFSTTSRAEAQRAAQAARSARRRRQALEASNNPKGGEEG